MATLQVQLKREQLKVQSLENDLEQKVHKQGVTVKPKVGAYLRMHHLIVLLFLRFDMFLFSPLRLKKSKMSQSCVMSCC